MISMTRKKQLVAYHRTRSSRMEIDCCSDEREANLAAGATLGRLDTDHHESGPTSAAWFPISVIHFARKGDEAMKPPSSVKTPQYIASLPADRAKAIATVRALVNEHIPPGYDECIVWGTIGWTIPCLDIQRLTTSSRSATSRSRRRKTTARST